MGYAPLKGLYCAEVLSNSCLHQGTLDFIFFGLWKGVQEEEIAKIRVSKDRFEAELRSLINLTPLAPKLVQDECNLVGLYHNVELMKLFWELLMKLHQTYRNEKVCS